MNKLMSLTGKAGLIISKHSPEILLGLGIAGFVGSLVAASKASIKAKKIIDDCNADLEKVNEAFDKIDKSEYSEKDYNNDKRIIYTKTTINVAKTYAPTILLATISIGSLLGSYGIIKKRHLAVIAAYNGLQDAFLDYRKRVIEEHGEEKDRMYKLGIKEEIKAETITGKNGKEKTVESSELVIDPNHHSQYARFFDSSSVQWNRIPEYNLMFLKTTQNYANDLLRSRGHIFLNEVYDMLGIPRSQAGQIVGWVKGEGDDFVDFGIFDDNGDSRDFVNGYKDSILLDFNVDGIVYDLI